MSQLARQQAQLLEALFAPRQANALAVGAGVLAPVHPQAHDQLARGLAAYRSHGRALARRALAAAYPCLAQRLGEDNFALLAVHFWLHCPPRSGDIAQWGDALSTFLRTLPDLCADEPCAVDLARLEWALHAMASGPDPQVDLASLALLMQHDPQHLRLVLAPSLFQIVSRWPLAAMLSDPEVPCDGASQDMPGAACHVLAWRQGLRPTWRAALPGEGALLAACIAGLSLSQSLAASPELDFAAWLNEAAHHGLLVGASAFA